MWYRINKKLVQEVRWDEFLQMPPSKKKSESAKGTRLELRQSHPIGIMYKLGILCRTDSKMQEDSRV